MRNLMNQPTTLKFNPKDEYGAVSWHKETKTFACEASDCGLGVFRIGDKLNLENTNLNKVITFECHKIDTYGGNEHEAPEVGGWRFKAIDGAKFYCELLVIND